MCEALIGTQTNSSTKRFIYISCVFIQDLKLYEVRSSSCFSSTSFFVLNFTVTDDDDDFYLLDSIFCFTVLREKDDASVLSFSYFLSSSAISSNIDTNFIHDGNENSSFFHVVVVVLFSYSIYIN